MTIFPKVKSLMKEKGMDDVLLFGGGIIPQEDIDRLKSMGIGELFTPGASTFTIVDYIKNTMSKGAAV
jgi:methylmalonyl-CoA mutase C-terminal domain/subunit